MNRLVPLAGVWAALLLVRCVGDDPNNGGGGGAVDAGGPDGQVQPTPDGGADGIAPDGASPADANTGPRCDLAKPFGLVEPIVGGVNTASGEEYARMNDNGLELYFTRFATGGYVPRIHRSTRATTTDAWGTAQEVVELNKRPGDITASATAPALTGDGLRIFMQLYDEEQTGSGNVFTSTRPNSTSPWGTPVLVDYANRAGADDGVWVTRGGERLYLFKGPPFRINVAQRSGAAGATYGNPTAFNAIHPTEDRAPVLSDDELTVYFAAYSTPPSEAGAPALRIYKATRADTGSQFSGLTYVPELNTDNAISIPTWLSKDGCEILLHSPRIANNYDIYRAVKPK